MGLDLKRLLSRLRRLGPAEPTLRPPTSPTVDRGREAGNEQVVDVSMDELGEFLEADLLDVKADPEFKERLREKLWSLVQSQLRSRSDDESAS